MLPTTRTLYLALGGVCVALLLLIIAELVGSGSGVDAPPSEAAATAEAIAGGQPQENEIDTQVAAIQERPLFTPGRHPPAPPVEDKPVDVQPEVKAPPELKGRLAGVTLGPDDAKFAVFARMGEKPVVVKEGDEIDGWKVATIEASRVVLTSSFGEKVVQPTAGLAGEGAAPEIPAARRGSNQAGVVPQPPPQMIRPPQPGVPGFPNPRVPPNAPGAVPNFVGAPPQGLNARAARRNQQ
jgi:hypothetical protein